MLSGRGPRLSGPRPRPDLVGSRAYSLALADAGSGAELLRTVDMPFRPGWTYTLVVTGQSAEDVRVRAIVDRGE